MIHTIIIIITTLVIYSAITTTIIALSGENENVIAICAMGISGLIAKTIVNMVKK